MPAYKVTVVETYTTEFSIDAATEDAATVLAEQLCIDGEYDKAMSWACVRASSAVVDA